MKIEKENHKDQHDDDDDDDTENEENKNCEHDFPIVERNPEADENEEPENEKYQHMDQCVVFKHQYVPPLDHYVPPMDDIEEPAEIDDALSKLVTTIGISATKEAFDTRIQKLEEDLRIAKNNVIVLMLTLKTLNEQLMAQPSHDSSQNAPHDVLKTTITSLEIQLQEVKTTKQNLQTKLNEKMESLRALREEIKELTKEGELLREKNKELLNENNSLKLVVAKCKQAFEKMKKKEDLLGMELYKKELQVKGLQ
ncbi:hypothetical protein Droror1_Dr00018713 [Drosera rotundifolia]